MTSPRPGSPSPAKIANAGGGILFVLAHPDDETFLCGGTIARYAAAGIDVHCICATRGEAGAMPPGMIGDRSVAEVRTEELTGAAEALGVRTVHFLDYRDSGMPGSPDADHPRALVNAMPEAIGQPIAALIRELRPRVVVTHGPFGEYGHPDHIHLHQATLWAYQAAANATLGQEDTEFDPQPESPEGLFVIALDPGGIRFLVRLLRLVRRDPRRFGRNADVDLVAIVENAPPATCVVDVSRWLAVRDRAARRHRSQLGRLRYLHVLPPRLRRRFEGTERYARIIPAPRPGAPVQEDLLRDSPASTASSSRRPPARRSKSAR